MFIFTCVCLVSNPPNDQDIIEVSKTLSAALGNDLDWENFGMYLLGTTNKRELTLIQQREIGKPLINKCQALLDLWKNKTAEPKWEQVIEALKKVDLNLVATELETVMIKSEQPNGACTIVDNHHIHHDQVHEQSNQKV